MELNALGEALLASIDSKFRPNELARVFPRIVNRMAKLWRHPIQIEKYFGELLLDTRGNRRGFPFKVLNELTDLKDYYQHVVFPSRRDIWQAGEE